MTGNQRRSVLRVLPAPSGTVDSGDRAHIWIYRGHFEPAPSVGGGGDGPDVRAHPVVEDEEGLLLIMIAATLTAGG